MREKNGGGGIKKGGKEIPVVPSPRTRGPIGPGGRRPGVTKTKLLRKRNADGSWSGPRTKNMPLRKQSQLFPDIFNPSPFMRPTGRRRGVPMNPTSSMTGSRRKGSASNALKYEEKKSTMKRKYPKSAPKPKPSANGYKRRPPTPGGRSF